MDAPLMFEVLLYLNIYYYGVFAGSEMLIFFAKFNSVTYLTPNINIDGAVVGVILTAELLKLFSFYKLRQSERNGLSNFLAIILTAISIVCALYILLLQKPVLKIEYMVVGIMLLLQITEFIYGFLQYIPCCKKKQYAE